MFCCEAVDSSIEFSANACSGFYVWFLPPSVVRAYSRRTETYQKKVFSEKASLPASALCLISIFTKAYVLNSQNQVSRSYIEEDIEKSKAWAKSKLGIMRRILAKNPSLTDYFPYRIVSNAFKQLNDLLPFSCISFAFQYLIERCMQIVIDNIFPRKNSSTNVNTKENNKIHTLAHAVGVGPTLQIRSWNSISSHKEDSMKYNK